MLSGKIEQVERRQWRSPFVEATLDDGTGSIRLRWVGRHAVPGVEPGARLAVEGTVLVERGMRVLLNPLYQFVEQQLG